MDEKVFIGNILVDSGTVVISDPCYLSEWNEERDYNQVIEMSGISCEIDAPGLRAVVSSAGFGDGQYPVYVHVRDFGPTWGKRVMKLEIDFSPEEPTLFTDEELEENVL